MKVVLIYSLNNIGIMSCIDNETLEKLIVTMVEWSVLKKTGPNELSERMYERG